MVLMGEMHNSSLDQIKSPNVGGSWSRPGFNPSTRWQQQSFRCNPDESLTRQSYRGRRPQIFRGRNSMPKTMTLAGFQTARSNPWPFSRPGFTGKPHCPPTCGGGLPELAPEPLNVFLWPANTFTPSIPPTVRPISLLWYNGKTLLPRQGFRAVFGAATAGPAHNSKTSIVVSRLLKRYVPGAFPNVVTVKLTVTFQHNRSSIPVDLVMKHGQKRNEKEKSQTRQKAKKIASIIITAGELGADGHGHGTTVPAASLTISKQAEPKPELHRRSAISANKSNFANCLNWR